MKERGGWGARVALGAGVLALAVAALAMLSGFGTRWGWWHFRTGFRLLGWSAMAGLGVAVLALLALALARRGPPRAWIMAGGALIVGITLFVVPWQWQVRARGVPPIHDISTDLEDPPAFVDVAPLRVDAPNTVDYAGDSTAVMQREAYPEVQPLLLDEQPAAAYERALEAARAMGWAIVAADASAGRIEATDRTFWFGFYDDVVIRLTPVDAGTRVDVRSKSRVGRGDAGTNARRVTAYLERLRS